MIAMIIISSLIVYSAPLPPEGTNPYHKALFKDWLNGTIDTTRSGALREGLNTSFYYLNFTGNLTGIGNINLTGSINISGGLSVGTLNAASCDLKADTQGNFYCGMDAGSDISVYNRGNFTFDLNNSNASIALWNITNDLKYISLRDSTWTIRLGNISNPNFMNDTLIVDGNLSVYGRLNATTILATSIPISIKSGDFDLRNISNYTEYLRHNTFSISSNISNYTTDFGFNESTAYWNITNIRVLTPRYAEFINLSGRNLTANNITSTRFTGKLDCGMIDGGSDGDFCADATGGGSESTNGSDSNIRFLNTTRDLNVYGNTTISNGTINLTTFGIAKFADHIYSLGEMVLLTLNISKFPFSNFQISNVSNTTKVSNILDHELLMKTADFNLQNISNDTLRISENESIALWNFTQGKHYLPSLIYPRSQNYSLLLGIANTSSNYTEVLTAIGSVSVYGSFNATKINATEIRQNNNMVQTINAVWNSVNMTTNSFFSSFFTFTNWTAGFGSGGNNSWQRENTAFNLLNNATTLARVGAFDLKNISNYTEYMRHSTFSLANISNYTQFIHQKDFNLNNITNNTIGFHSVNFTIGKTGTQSQTMNFSYGQSNSTCISFYINNTIVQDWCMA